MAVVLLVLSGVLVGLLWAVQRRLVYFPDGGPVPAAADALPGGRDVTLTTADGLRLGAWWVPAPTADAATVLVAAGNGGSRTLRAPLARALSAAGLGVLLFDYRGYGGNPGSPSEEGLALDVRAARSSLVEAGVRPDRLLYHGESLGCAVVTELAVEHPPAGLVLRSPFVDLAAVGSAHHPYLPVRALLRDRYPVAEQVARVAAPRPSSTAAATRSCPRRRAGTSPRPPRGCSGWSRCPAPTTTTPCSPTATRSWPRSSSWRTSPTPDPQVPQKVR